MPLSDKLSHLGWDEHNHPYPNETHQKINLTNLVIDNNIRQYKFTPNQNIE